MQLNELGSQVLGTNWERGLLIEKYVRRWFSNGMKSALMVMILSAYAAVMPALELPQVVVPQVSVPQLIVPHAAVAPTLLASVPMDAAWRSAVVIPELTASKKIDRAADPKPLPTQIRLLWDATFLYVRFDATDVSTYVPFSKHDEPLYQGDVAEVFLDAVGDAHQWFEIQVAANNTTFDQNLLLTATPKSDADGKLDGALLGKDFWLDLSFEMTGLKTAASQRPDGWTVEMAIPAATAARRLGVQQWQAGQKLRANLLRYDWGQPDAKGERVLQAMNWARVLDGCPHISPQAMGVLELAP